MPRTPPKEWFYYVVGELKKLPYVTDPKALAGWLWHYHMKPETKGAILKGEGKRSSVRNRMGKDHETISRGKLDPESIRKREGLIKSPKVLRFNDLKGEGLVRVLHRQGGSYFPEFAFYPRARAFLKESLKDAAFNEEEAGKWVLRTNKFNVFVYV